MDIDKLKDLEMDPGAKGVSIFWKKIMDLHDLTATTITSTDDAAKENWLRESSSSQSKRKKSFSIQRRFARRAEKAAKKSRIDRSREQSIQQYRLETS